METQMGFTRGFEVKTYQVWGLDTVGNEIDGYEVNDRYKMGTIQLPADATNKEIWGTLLCEQYLSEKCESVDLFIDGDDTMIFIDEASSGYPLYQLEQIEG